MQFVCTFVCRKNIMATKSVRLSQVLTQIFHKLGSLVPSAISFNSKKNGLINLRSSLDSASMWFTKTKE